MNKKEHDEAVTSLKEICRKIGCSKLSSYMCDETPQWCAIIRKLCSGQAAEKQDKK